MAGQRRGEPGVHRGRRLPCLGRLVLALSLLLSAAGCGNGGPAGPQRPVDDSGSTDGETAAGRLAGTWRTTLIVEVPGDIQTWITTWRFDREGGCLQTQEVRSVVEGVPRITERTCAFTADGFEITIAYDGGATLVFDYTFSLFSSDVLILDGLEYERITP